ncbi:hypothetical protein B0T14DRAFT_499828 [Immersiella caudata]|uniref:Uncharacterized protein n=1 Tax=Immersiella caudata TaxID=314043 RepID=A0AA39WFS3_9PEZI|nr:hypothetical protein B0T14DRAFT_499828 [Immersiella caudata]
MKANIGVRLSLVVALIALSFTATAAGPASQNTIQHPLTKAKTISMSETEASNSVPGNNDAFFGPVPKAEQIFYIRFLEIAPTPIPVSKYFFLLIRGWIPASTRQKLNLELAHLAAATLTISSSAVLDDGAKLERSSVAIPFRTVELGEGAHIGIRNATGAYVDHLALEGQNEILTDYWIPGPFVKTGVWTFEVVASLGGEGKEGVCLFALSLTQRLEGTPGW